MVLHGAKEEAPVKPYRCEKCEHTPERCKACRKRRRAAINHIRQLRRDAGQCVQCGAKAAKRDGEPLTLCKYHLTENNRLSRESRSRSRQLQM